MKTRIALLLGALALPAAGSAAPAEDPSPIVARLIEWRGGKAFEDAAAIHLVGRIEAMGQAGRIERWIEPARSRERIELGAFTQDSGFAGGAGWAVNLSGQVEDAGPARIASARRASLLELDEALKGAGGARVALAGDEDFDGRRLAVLRISFGDADVYDLLVDRATGVLHATRRVEDRRTTVTRFADWRRIDGVRIAHRWQVDSEIDAEDATVTLTRAEIGRGFDDAVFARPASRQAYSFDPGARGSTGQIAFDFFNSNRIYIPARVNGVETLVLLDSGAESSVLSAAFARQIGVTAASKVTAVGTGGTQDAGLARGVEVRIGPMTLNDLTVGIIDLEGVEKQLGRPLPVILGKEVFNELVVDIDFDRKLIAFHDPASFVPPAGAQRLTLTEHNGLRTIEAAVEGGAPVRFDFDIGNGSPLILFPAYVEAARLDDGRPKSQTLSGAIGGMRTADTLTVRTLSLGGVDFRDVPATVPPKGTSAVDGSRVQGNIGLPILSRFRLAADFGRNALYLTPLAERVGDPFRKDRSGLVAVPEGEAMKVMFVAPGSPAAAAGIKAGDLVTLADGQRPDPASWTRLRTGKAGESLALAVNGRAVTLTLRDYY
jgi:hypothetical protein